MAQEVILPRQGQSVETCHILEWKKKVGQAVKEGEVLCTVETDKAAFDVESTASGTLLHIFHTEGEDVPVLSPLALVGAPGEEVSAVPPGAAGEAAREAGAAAMPPRPEGGAHPPGGSGAAGKVAISPRARRLAESRGASPARVAAAIGSGSGPRGRILEKDVRAYLEGAGVPTAGPAGIAPARTAAAPESEGLAEAELIPPEKRAADFPGPATEVVVKGVRKLIAERMHASLSGTAQYTLSSSASAEVLLAFRQRLKDSPEEQGLRSITITDMINFAAARVLPRYQDLNCHFTGEKILRFERVHLGVAVDTSRGLMVPVVRNASLLSLKEIAWEAKRLQAACREGRINPDQLAGGTFTVTNLGNLGVESFTPILNAPQVAILGVGNIQLKPVQEGGQVVFRRFIGLCLTANHQVVDGAPAARFLRELCQAVERFDLMLAV